MADETKVEETTTTEASAENTAAKKGVDLNELAAKGKDGINKGMGFVSELYTKDAKKGLLMAQAVPALMFLLTACMGRNIIGMIILILLAVANFFGVEAIKKGMPDTTPKG